MLELPLEKKRLFLEYETGTLVLRDASKKTSTITKLARYTQFFTGLADPVPRTTHCANAFADDWRPSLVFVTRTAARKLNILKLLAESKQPPSALTATAVTLEEALAYFPERGAKISPPADPISAPSSNVAPEALRQPSEFMCAEEIALLQGFFQESIQRIHECRNLARSGGVKPPGYPARSSDVKELLDRLMLRVAHTLR